MPNGNSEQFAKELPVLEAFFEKISDSLVIFAKKHNLLIDKYYHQMPDWTFRFRHPKGGQGCMVVRKKDENELYLLGSWWKDDYESDRRDFRDTITEICAINHVILKMEKILEEILSWDINDLNQGTKNFCIIWKNKMTKEEFEKVDQKYPIARL